MADKILEENISYVLSDPHVTLPKSEVAKLCRANLRKFGPVFFAKAGALADARKASNTRATEAYRAKLHK